MGKFEELRLYDPKINGENRLSPRATNIPALKRGISYKNRLESELITDLNGEYRFCWREMDDREDFYRLDFEDGEWDRLMVPSMWQYHGYSAPLYPNVEYPIPFVPPYVGNRNPVGYYRRWFRASKGGKKILYFGGVDNAFFVYLNGEYIGFSKGSRMAAEFDVSNFIKEGENLLCVKVFTYSSATYLENQDMLLASGIFRDVMLYSLEEAYLWDYCLQTEGDAVALELSFQGTLSSKLHYKVALEGMVQEGQAEKEISLRFLLKDPIRWNAEQPHTYEITISLYRGEELLELHTKRFGFAEFKTEGNHLLLNGQQITLKGINRHEHDPKNGRAITVEMIERELQLIKSHNMNAIRCAHYPNDPAFYEICTVLGIYVMNEADLETHGAHLTGDMGYFAKLPEWESAFLDRVERMYERDKNETSISIWTLGNENGDGENLYRCFEYLKSRPVKKPVMHTGDSGADPKISEFRAFGYHSMEQMLRFPAEGKPLMMLEYGHAMGNSPGLMKDTWDYVYRHRHLCGGYVWEFKNHGFYQEDQEGTPFYQYGGDFGDLNHWSNFSMDGYCLSDGTPKPSLRECKNILAPAYVYYENGQVMLMNTNDFRPLDYLMLEWALLEDYKVLEKGEMPLPALLPYEKMELPRPKIESPKAGAEYFLNLRFLDETGEEIAFKQVSFGILKEKELFREEKEALAIEESGDEIFLKGADFKIGFSKGMLRFLEKKDEILFDEPMELNLYRAPIDNDGIIGWEERWIADWNKRFYRHFEFILLKKEIEPSESGGISLKFFGKWAPISKYIGFDLSLCYTIYKEGKIFLEINGNPYGKFGKTLPRIGLCLPLDKKFKEAIWYGRGEDECYGDRCEHCNFGRYQLPIEKMNFIYDVPQECGTRIDTRFLKLGNLSFIGSERFAFSYHDFSLSDLIAARHRNELKRSDKNYLYLDYAMRGLGSFSCGPDPEECYELRPHPFRFSLMIAPAAAEEELLSLCRKEFPARTEKRGETFDYKTAKSYTNIVECKKE